jgi:CRP-like cAMP-binding protein
MIGTFSSADSALKGCPLLAGIPSEDLRRDCPTARIVAIRHRGTIYRQGEPGRTVFCVLDGQVTIARVLYDGATLTTAALGAGDFFGPALSGATAAEDTARAKGAVSIWRAPIDEFRRLLLHYPAVAWEFVSLLALRQRQMERRLESFAFKRTEARLAETFRELSGGFATASALVTWALKHPAVACARRPPRARACSPRSRNSETTRRRHAAARWPVFT